MHIWCYIIILVWWGATNLCVKFFLRIGDMGHGTSQLIFSSKSRVRRKNQIDNWTHQCNLKEICTTSFGQHIPKQQRELASFSSMKMNGWSLGYECRIRGNPKRLLTLFSLWRDVTHIVDFIILCIPDYNS